MTTLASLLQLSEGPPGSADVEADPQEQLLRYGVRERL